MCGTATNIVTMADATAGQSADSKYLPEFVRLTAENFQVRKVSADAAYSANSNLEAVDEVGGVAYIPFKRPSVYGKGTGKRSDLWMEMLRLFTDNRAEFDHHYHQRSKVETVFHQLKAKFGDRVRAKNPVAQVNEALTKVLCHNIVTLIHAMYALGVTPRLEVPTSPSALPAPN